MTSTAKSGPVVLITGGANGMGECEAKLFAERGYTVVIADRDGERTPLVTEEIKTAGGSAEGVVIDIRDEDAFSSLIARTARDYGSLDVLVNNAAALELCALDPAAADVTSETFMETLRTDLLPAFLGCKYSLPIMVEQGKGSIVNIASVTGEAGETTLPSYGVAKAGVIQLTRMVATQYSKKGVRCNAVSPAFVLTRNNLTWTPERMANIYRRAMLTPDAVHPEKVAETVFFLGSDAAEYITGETIRVDGGLMAGSPIAADYRDWNDGLGPLGDPYPEL